jgi:hypothetical protein
MMLCEVPLHIRLSGKGCIALINNAANALAAFGGSHWTQCDFGTDGWKK